MDEKPLKPIVSKIFSKLAEPAQHKHTNLADCWPEIVGPAISQHTKPRFLPGGRMTVWVDDSTLAFELSQRHKPSILKRLQNQFGEDEVKDIRFLVGQIR